MPKSRGRKQKRSQQQRRSSPPRPHPSLADMEPWLRAMVESGNAEARGDAAGALDVIEPLTHGPDGKPFWRPWRLAHLLQIAVLGPFLPRWVTSRWILNQAMVSMHPSHRARVKRALDLAVELRGGLEKVPGSDEYDALGRVQDRDWVYRQLLLYDCGALGHFIRTVASPDLLIGADSIRDWAQTPMGGYRLVGARPAETTWLDLASEEQYATANIGSAVSTRPGDHVIGRLVPIERGAMFETAPMHVSEPVARKVAEAPTDWFVTLRATRSAGDPVTSVLHPECLASDVPAGVWLPVVLPGFRPPGKQGAELATSKLARSVLDAAAQLADKPARAAHGVDPWPCLAAALVEPDVAVTLLDVVRPGDIDVLRRLSGLLAEPASSICRALSERRHDAA